jgi:hypothetical protein
MKTLYRTTLFTAAVLSAGIFAAPATFAADPGASPAAVGTPAPAQMETLVVGKIKIGDALAQAAGAEGRSNQLARVAEAMDSQFNAALAATKKFKIVAGSNLDQIMAQQKRGGSGLYSSEDANAVKIGELRPAKYVVVPTIDDFQDVGETLRSEGHEEMATARRIRISVVATLYDINTGEEKETANIQVSDRKATQEQVGIAKTGDFKEELLHTLVMRAANQSAAHVVDWVFPAKIIARTDKTVTINRGKGSTVEIGQVWDVFALGEEMKDPDTGASLGREEVAAGKVRVTSITPMFSKAEVIEDLGVDKGQIVRLHEGAATPTAAGAGPVAPKTNDQ